DSEPFTVGDVTCLVGKNEAGKTALLDALYRLNPYDTSQKAFDKALEYPRRYLDEYDERHGGKEAIVTRTIWTLDDDDRSAVDKALGEGNFPLEELEISRSYGDNV